MPPVKDPTELVEADPKQYSVRRRRGRGWILVNKQILYWRDRMRQEKLKAKAEAAAKAEAIEAAKTDREKFESWSMFRTED